MSDSKKPRVLIILPDRINQPVGGLGVQCKYMIEHMKDDVEFDVIGHPDPEGPDYYTGVSNPLPNVEHASLITAVGQIEYFAASIDRPKPDIVHAYDWSTYLSGIYAARFFKVPLVVTMQLSINLLNREGIFYAHDANSIDGISINKVHTETELLGLEKADRIVHVSNAYAANFNHVTTFRNKSVIVPNGIDLAEWESYEKVALPGTRKIKVVYIGRIALMKNIEVLLQAKVPDDIDLIFVGTNNGGENFVFEAMLEKSRTHDNMHYYGPAYEKDKINVLRSADAVIMPSRHEPFGIVALEALAAQSVLISSFEGGMGDFLTEDVAIKCGTTAEGVERAYRTLLNMGHDEKAARKARGLEICTQYTWSEAARKLKVVYDELFQNDHAKPSSQV